MITNLMNLLNATNITISATKANELYQVVIVADNASEITITGNKDEIDNDLEKVIIDNIEAILKAKKQITLFLLQKKEKLVSMKMALSF